MKKQITCLGGDGQSITDSTKLIQIDNRLKTKERHKWSEVCASLTAECKGSSYILGCQDDEKGSRWYPEPGEGNGPLASSDYNQIEILKLDFN